MGIERISFGSARGPILGLAALLASLVGVSGYALLAGLDDLERARESRSWPTTRATIVSVDVRRRAEPRIRYRYTVDGVAYGASRVSFGRVPPLRDLSEYRPGGEVEIAYHPERPGHAVLIPGGSPLRMGPGFYVAAVSLGVGALGLVVLGLGVSWRS